MGIPTFFTFALGIGIAGILLFGYHVSSMFQAQEQQTHRTHRNNNNGTFDNTISDDERKRRRRKSYSSECVVCFDESSITIRPCGHTCLCQNCASVLMKESSLKCPLCRVTVKKFELH